MERIIVKPYNKYVYPDELVNYITDSVLVWDIEENEQMNNFVCTFNSANALVKCINQNIRNGAYNKRSSTSSERASEKYQKWCFGSDYPTKQHTDTALLTGCVLEKTLKQYEKAKEKTLREFPELLELRQLAFKNRRKRKFAEDGGELDIDRLMCGDPEHWVTNNPIKDKKTIRVVYNAAMSAKHKPEEFIEDMILCTIFIELIEVIGLSVELWYATLNVGAMSSINENAFMFKLKDAEQRVDVQNLLSCGLPGLLRFYIFEAWVNIMPGTPQPGLGRPLGQMPAWFLNQYDFDAGINSRDNTAQKVSLLTDTIKSLLV